MRKDIWLAHESLSGHMWMWLDAGDIRKRGGRGEEGGGGGGFADRSSTFVQDRNDHHGHLKMAVASSQGNPALLGTGFRIAAHLDDR